LAPTSSILSGEVEIIENYFYLSTRPLHDGKLLQLIVAAKKSFEESRYNDVVSVSFVLVLEHLVNNTVHCGLSLTILQDLSH